MLMQLITGSGEERRVFVDQLKKRGDEKDRRVEQTVAEILQNVRENGDSAVRAYTEKFDGRAPEQTEVSRKELEDCLQSCDPKFRQALQDAARNIRDFHERQKQQSWLTTREDGTVMGQRVRGLHRVGIYVPGGTAAYPSSVLMNAIPAHVAGVDRVFLMGGAQAVAALAYGTETVPRVDKIVGPGNIFVATAKKLLYGTVDIDMIAGPSEILIVADDSANPRFLAADLMSQAEHDRLASAILITTAKRSQSRRNRNWLCRCKPCPAGRLSKKAYKRMALPSCATPWTKLWRLPIYLPPNTWKCAAGNP